MFENVCSSLYEWLIIEPLQRLYRYGPSIYQIGFWEGKEDSEICRTLTNHNQLFWQNHDIDCNILIKNRFESFKTTIEVCFYFLLLFRIINMVLSNFSLQQFLRFLINKPEKKQIFFIPSQDSKNYITCSN